MSDQGEAAWNSWIEAAKKEKEKKEKEERTKRFKSMSSIQRQDLIKKKAEDKKIRENKLPVDYYKSEEYKKFCEERTKKYKDLIKKGEIPEPTETIVWHDYQEKVFIGERGGRYRYRYNRNGQPYRDYF